MNSVVRCHTSWGVAHLLEWRNQTNHSRFAAITKAVAAECALPFLTVAALVETVVYGALRLGACLFLNAQHPQRLFYAKAFDSALFTTAWSVALLGYNMFQDHLYAHEAEARCFAKIPRVVDLLVVQHLRGVGKAQSVLNIACSLHAAVRRQMGHSVDSASEAIQFLLGEILKDLSFEALESFYTMDPVMYPFVAAKAVYLYLFEKRAEPVPRFFKQETRDGIECLRWIYRLENVTEELRAMMKDPHTWNGEFQDRQTQELFRGITRVSHEELQNGFLLVSCWDYANQCLQSPMEAAI